MVAAARSRTGSRCQRLLAVAIACGACSLSAAPAVAATGTATPTPAALASALQSESVQSFDVPRGNFSYLSVAQIDRLRAQIAALDPGRIWIAVVSPRSASALARLAQPTFDAMPAGTLIAVAEDPRNPDQTNYWVGASWEPGNTASGQLNDVIDGFDHGQGSLVQDLALEIRSFARGDANAGHPASSGNSGSGSSGSASSSGAGTSGVSTGGASGAAGGGGVGAGLIVLAVLAGIAALFAVVSGARWTRTRMRASHVHREQSEDAHELAQKNFAKLGEQIQALDVDSSMPNADPAAKDEYAKALDCYEEAERRLKSPDDDYRFGQAVQAIDQGLAHIANADKLFGGASAGGSSPQPAAALAEVDRLSELAELHSRGMLTDDEFAEQKRKLINS